MSEQPSVSVESRLDELFQPYNRGDTPGLVSGVAREGRVIYRRGFGLACIQHGVANTPRTRMRIGSTSKHFACLAALLLAEEGKLDIDAPATEYVPELPPLRGVPSLRQFMNHTSGYRCGLDLASTANGMAVMPAGWIVDATARQRDVNFEPGHGQMYCNGGYHVLSRVIERISGQPLAQFLQHRIFAPLGMNDTELVPSDHWLVPGLATLHVPQPDGGWRRGALISEEVLGEGGIVSTVDDMLRWLAHLRRPDRVGSGDSWRQMLEPPVLANGLRSVYALGLYRHAYRGVEVIHHAGGVIGGNSQMLTVPSLALDVILMVNGLPLSAIETTKKVVDLVLDGQLPEAATPLASKSQYPHLVGARYHGRSGMLLSFGEVGDTLGLAFLNNPPMPILRDTGETLQAGFEDVALGPLVFRAADLAPDADGKAPATLPFGESGEFETLARLPDQLPPTTCRSQDLVGRYVSHDLGAEARIELAGEKLLLKLKGEFGPWREFAVTPYSASAFGLQETGLPGASLALTTEQAHGLVESFRIESIRVRHLQFLRLRDTSG
jgi:CubicO group peptidase (beta-lactamase class C family)